MNQKNNDSGTINQKHQPEHKQSDQPEKQNKIEDQSENKTIEIHQDCNVILGNF